MMIWVGTTVVARIAATLRRFHVHCFTDGLLSREIQRQTTFLFHSRIVQTGHGNLKKKIILNLVVFMQIKMTFVLNQKYDSCEKAGSKKTVVYENKSLLAG